jgi:ElaB/YqjD/DUF883 family membrane-anchored ribosome-binding protein
MQPGSIDAVATLQQLYDQVEHTLEAALRHARGELDVGAYEQACAALAAAFAKARPALQRAGATADGEQQALRQRLGQRLQTLLDCHSRLQASNRSALAALLPSDVMQEYARLGQRGPRRGAYG